MTDRTHDPAVMQFTLTSAGCPEQYDAFLGGEKVGYLRLRHGEFTVECPDCNGLEVYKACPSGDGAFERNERDYYLRFAADAIHRWMVSGCSSKSERPEAPNVEYVRSGGLAWCETVDTETP